MPKGAPKTGWNFHCIWNTYYRFTYTRPSGAYQKRLLCDAGTEGSTYPTNIFWKGFALDYWEKISINQTRIWNPTTATGQNDGYIGNANVEGSTFYAIKLTSLNAGYYPNLQDSAGQIWGPGLNWRGSYNWCDDNGNGGTVSLKTASTEISLRSVSGKKTSYDHILHFNSKTLKYLSDVDWLNTLGTDADTTLTRDGMAKATGTSISIPFNFPTVSGDLIGNENIHYFLLKNISNSNITLTLVPQPSQVISIIGNLTPMTLQANNSIEISTKVMDNNWIISKSMEMPISVERPNLNNVIHYTSSNGNVVTPNASNVFGANI